MAFVSCTSCEHVDKSEENFTSQHEQDSGTPYAAVQEDQDRNTQLAGATDALPERSRLREFVKDFAKCAVRGVACVAIQSRTGETMQLTYHVDPSLQQFFLRHTQKEGVASALPYRNFDLARVQEVHDIESAKSTNGSLLPEPVLRAADREGTRDGLLVITFEDGTEPAHLLEGSSVDRDRFIMCVKILKIFAQNAHSFGDGTGASGSRTK
mmetsp:Transcript_96335/g.190836  ORF Transcript_96335/g.190836 Transcript_96335/m.190836 type:complete len:211 (+) Transcript_96335:60-692(+)